MDARILASSGGLGRQEGWNSIPDRKGGTVSLYHGQKYDPDKIDLVEDGWCHDHCEICCWNIYESEDSEHGEGYTDGDNWICLECYDKVLRKSGGS